MICFKSQGGESELDGTCPFTIQVGFSADLLSNCDSKHKYLAIITKKVDQWGGVRWEMDGLLLTGPKAKPTEINTFRFECKKIARVAKRCPEK